MGDSFARFDRPLLEATVIVRELLARAEVARAWDRASALPALTVGGLACHLGRQVTNAARLLPTPTDLPRLSTVDEHYSRAAWTTATSLDDPANDRSHDDTEAAAGVAALRERVSAAADEVAALIAADAAQPVVPLPWQGWSLRRADFVLTRLLEIVVHTDDLAVSVELPTPRFPDEVADPVFALLTRLAVRRHGQSAVIATLARRERARPVFAF